MEKLRQDGTKRAPRHDDGSLGPEGTAGADRDGGRYRLEQSHLWLNETAPKQNCLERFGNPVTADLLRAVARHQTNHERARHRRGDHPRAEMVMLERPEDC